MTGPCTSSKANEGVESLLLAGFTFSAHPSRPLNAPVALPGLTKKRPSKSNASKLLSATSVVVSSPVRAPVDEDVDVHLAREGGEHVAVASGHDLLAMD
jgi:hypothetical protein